MRFLTPLEQALLDSLPETEAHVVRALFETGARLVSEGESGEATRPLSSRLPSSSAETSQSALFPMRKEGP